jgi:hypothetical protein
MPLNLLASVIRLRITPSRRGTSHFKLKIKDKPSA